MLLFIALVDIVSASPGEPVLLASGARVASGEAAVFTFRPAAGRSVSIDGCAALELERREGEAWVVAPGAVTCDGSLPARSASKELTFTVAPPGPGEYRGVIAWGVGCVEGRSFSLGACTSRGVARSASFTVEPPPPVEPQR